MYAAFNQESFDWGECLVAAGAGGVAGGLIGSGLAGVGAAGATGAALAVASTAINVGAGAAGAGAGYVVTSPDSFDNTSFAINTGFGGAIGGISGAIPAQGVGLLAKGLVNQAGSVAQYSTLQTVNGRTITGDGIANSLIGGTIAGIADMGASAAAAQLRGGFQPGQWVNAGNASLLSVAARRAAGEAAVGIVYGGTTGLISGVINSKIPPFRLNSQPSGMVAN